MDGEALLVKVHVNGETGDRTLTVNHWPKHTWIDDFFLKHAADQNHVAVDGDTVTLTVANGQAVYELGEYSVYSMSREAWLVSSRLSEWDNDDGR